MLKCVNSLKILIPFELIIPLPEIYPKQKEKNMVTLVKTATAPVGLLGLTQHRENSGELTKPGEM